MANVRQLFWIFRHAPYLQRCRLADGGAKLPKSPPLGLDFDDSINRAALRNSPDWSRFR
jgi:hypothetical protein